MTGTPILNRPEELYSLLSLIAPHEFPTRASFRRNYLVYDYDVNAYVFRPGGEASLAERLSGMYLRRTHKSAGIVLPKQDIIIHEIELDPALYPRQTEILQMLADHAAIEIESGKASSMMSILSLITRQRQAATWPGGIVLHEQVLDEYGFPVEDDEGKPVIVDIPIGLKYQESVKIDRAVELTKEFIDDEQRIVVFSQFRSVLEELQSRFDSLGIRAVSFHGGTSPDTREQIKNNFDRSRAELPQWEVVLCHYKTGGVGLNLTAATATIIMDEEWNPGKNEQAYDRTHRIGQTDETSIHILRLADSIDIWMEALIKAKGTIIGKFESAQDAVKKDIIEMFRGKAKVDAST
jgi:SNF2 family DNA or RNA helicase